MKSETARREIESLDYYLQNHTNDYSEESHTAMMMAIDALSSSEKPYKWTPVKYIRPIVGQDVEVCDIDGDIYITYLHTDDTWGYDYCGCKIKNVVAWRELPEPYRAESEDKE